MPLQTKIVNGVKWYRWGTRMKWQRSLKKVLEIVKAIFAQGWREK
jgi:hypothetical protein